MTCHNFDTEPYPEINLSFFGVHRDINITDGPGIFLIAIAMHATMILQKCSRKVLQ